MINQKKITTLTKKSELKKTILRSDLCDFIDTCIAVKGNIIVTNPDDAKRNKIVFKNNAPFISCILKISSVQIDNAEDLMLQYKCTICLNAVKIVEKQQEVYGIITKMNQVTLFLLILIFYIKDKYYRKYLRW